MFFFLNDPATTEIYTLPLHDALPILRWEYMTAEKKLVVSDGQTMFVYFPNDKQVMKSDVPSQDEATSEIGRAHRLNSSHANISYAVFCLKKKKITRRLCSTSSLLEQT